MKKLLLILLCVPLIGFGQKAPPSVLSTTNTTFLYAGIANPVEIGVEGKLNKNLFVTYEHRSGFERVLESDSNGKYIIIPNRYADRDQISPSDSTITIPPVRTISIYERVINKDLFGKVIDTTQVKLASYAVNVLSVPPPDIYLKGFKNVDTISKSDLMSTYIRLDGHKLMQAFPLKYRIKTCDMRIISSRNGKVQVLPRINPIFKRGKAAELIKKCRKGDVVIFDNIRYKLKNGKMEHNWKAAVAISIVIN